MPDMPEPPMPTKWTRFTLCRMGKLHAQVGTSAGGVGFAEGARLARNFGESISIKAKQDLRELFGLGGELVQRDARVPVGEEPRVGGLLVDHEPGEWKEDRGHASRRDLGDGDRPRAADEQVAPRIAPRHVVDE